MQDKLRKTIGVLGGGQLGKMLIESCTGLNLKYQVLEKSNTCPAHLVCNNIIEGSLYDAEAIKELASKSDVLTYEIEHVNVEALKAEEASTPVIPYPRVLEIIQDKGLQKEFYRDHEIDTLPFTIASADELKDTVLNWDDDRFVLKHRKGGYDGRGVELLDKAAFKLRADANDPSFQSEHGYVIEKLAEKAREFSVIVARDQDGKSISYAPSEMVFDPKANLMDYLIAPVDLNDDQITLIKSLAIRAVNALNSPGVFAVELITDPNGKFYVNEIAPRPHNSGHHTIESTVTSQYEQLNRILLGLPLGSTKLLAAALTANILGPEGVNGAYYLKGIEETLKIEGVYVHMYGKSTTSPYRKLGHFTVIGESPESCINKMNEVRNKLEIASLD